MISWYALEEESMKLAFRFVMTILMLAAAVVAQTDARAEQAVRQTVESFYEAFKMHSFNNAEKFATEDWDHINPFGGRTRGREATLRELKEVHSTFLKGVSDKIEDMDVRFAGADAAVVTVTRARLKVSGRRTFDLQDWPPCLCPLL
jgi:ketosteroid isomerase-like protein